MYHQYESDYGLIVFHPHVGGFIGRLNETANGDRRKKTVREARQRWATLEAAINEIAQLCAETGVKPCEIFKK